MAKSEEKLLARKLRKSGRSVRSIADEISVSKASVSLWCSDIELSKSQKQKLYENAIKQGAVGRMRGAEGNKRKKEEAIITANKWAAKTLGNMTKRDLLIVGAALYWAEGSKTRGQFSFTNSDPMMARLMVDWIRHVCKVDNEDFLLRVAVNEVHKPRIDLIEKFWSKTLSIPRKQFYSPSLIKTKLKKVYDNHDNYHGMIVIRFRRSTMIKYRLLGLIKTIQEKYPRPG